MGGGGKGLRAAAKRGGGRPRVAVANATPKTWPGGPDSATTSGNALAAASGLSFVGSSRTRYARRTRIRTEESRASDARNTGGSMDKYKGLLHLIFKKELSDHQRAFAWRPGGRLVASWLHSSMDPTMSWEWSQAQDGSLEGP